MDLKVECNRAVLAHCLLIHDANPRFKYQMASDTLQRVYGVTYTAFKQVFIHLHLIF
jgi:hypothetical protein